MFQFPFGIVLIKRCRSNNRKRPVPNRGEFQFPFGIVLIKLGFFFVFVFCCSPPRSHLCVGGFVQFLYICHLIIFFIKDSISRRDCGDMLLLFLGDYNWVSVSFWPTYFLFCLCGCFFEASCWVWYMFVFLLFLCLWRLLVVFCFFFLPRFRISNVARDLGS